MRILLVKKEGGETVISLKFLVFGEAHSGKTTLLGLLTLPFEKLIHRISLKILEQGTREEVIEWHFGKLRVKLTVWEIPGNFEKALKSILQLKRMADFVVFVTDVPRLKERAESRMYQSWIKILRRALMPEKGQRAIFLTNKLDTVMRGEIKEFKETMKKVLGDLNKGLERKIEGYTLSLLYYVGKVYFGLTREEVKRLVQRSEEIRSFVQTLVDNKVIKEADVEKWIEKIHEIVRVIVALEGNRPLLNLSHRDFEKMLDLVFLHSVEGLPKDVFEDVKRRLLLEEVAEVRGISRRRPKTIANWFLDGKIGTGELVGYLERKGWREDVVRELLSHVIVGNVKNHMFPRRKR